MLLALYLVPTEEVSDGRLGSLLWHADDATQTLTAATAVDA